MRDFDRRASTFVWAFFFVLALIMAVPMAVLALTARRESEQIAAGAFALLSFPMVMGIAVLVAALMRSLKRNDGVLRALEHLRARMGGSVLLPTIRYPVVQPRIITQHRGRELEVRFVRYTRRQAITHGGEWHLVVMVAARPAFKLALVTKQFMLETIARIFGTPIVHWDERLALLSSDPQHASSFFNDAYVLPHWQRVFTMVPAHAKLQFAPVSTLNYLGALFSGPWDPHRSPDEVLAIVESVTAMAERLDGGAPR